MSTSPRTRSTFSLLALALGVILAAGFLLPLVPADANTVVRSGETVSVADDQQVEGDFYVSAGIASMSGRVTGDMYALAGTLTVNGEVAADLFALTGSAQVHASVTDDVRIVAGDVTIAEHVGGDLVVIGGSLTLLSTANVAGDVLFYGGEAELAGTIGGNVMGAAERFRIDGPVAGSVDVTAQSVVLGERADVTGDVRYVSGSELTRAQNAVVAGEVVRSDLAAAGEAPRDWRGFLIPLLILLFGSLSLHLLARRPLEGVVTDAQAHFWRASLLGLIVLLTGPVLAAFLLASILASLLGVFVLFAWLLVIVLALLMVGPLFGAALSGLVKRGRRLDVLSITLGVATLGIALLIPVVGAVVFIVLLTALMGTLTRQAYRRYVGHA